MSSSSENDAEDSKEKQPDEGTLLIIFIDWKTEAIVRKKSKADVFESLSELATIILHKAKNNDLFNKIGITIQSSDE